MAVVVMMQVQEIDVMLPGLGPSFDGQVHGDGRRAAGEAVRNGGANVMIADDMSGLLGVPIYFPANLKRESVPKCRDGGRRRRESR